MTFAFLPPIKTVTCEGSFPKFLPYKTSRCPADPEWGKKSTTSIGWEGSNAAASASSLPAGSEQPSKPRLIARKTNRKRNTALPFFFMIATMLINDVYWLSFHMLTVGLRSASRRSGQQDSLVYRLSLQGILDRSEGTYRTVKKCIK